jgi:hypothetical protein
MSIEEEFFEVPRSYLYGSTVYSSSEVSLLKWLEGVNFNIRSQKKQLMNFDKDLRNGLNFAAVLHQYSDNSARPLRLMNDPGLTEDDIKINMAALRDSMVELNLNYIPPSNVFCNLNNL